MSHDQQWGDADLTRTFKKQAINEQLDECLYIQSQANW